MYTITADAAWQRMLAGNRRYASEEPLRANISAEQRRRAVHSGQQPLAAVVACSDSRVPVEYIFDMGVGELFVIRVAGNVIGAQEAGSIEYALEHLHVPLILILGHTGCGAVSAALFSPCCVGAIHDVLEKIVPAAERARAHCGAVSSEELLSVAIRENIFQAMTDLFSISPAVRTAARSNSVQVAGALYDIKTGTVAGPRAEQPYDIGALFRAGIDHV